MKSSGQHHPQEDKLHPTMNRLSIACWHSSYQRRAHHHVNRNVGRCRVKSVFGCASASSQEEQRAPHAAAL